MTGVDYIIEPIAGREAIQRNFATLPERAKGYSNRRVSLNERFSIIERGYWLKPVSMEPYVSYRNVVLPNKAKGQPGKLLVTFTRDADEEEIIHTGNEVWFK
ncbi:unnamed protein product [Nippostrongylus brasiliensis]|uniref:Outer membrane protein assembly factor BamE n=1 Tax=Nippostrongylus brasiliensis TaxID=27835 RepID=A0A0N4Y9K6_NIPBR|nr:unnamed protein product [Nippostrongylus brasiliensis]